METPALRLEARAASDQAGRRAARACDSKTLLRTHARVLQRKHAERMVSLAVGARQWERGGKPMLVSAHLLERSMLARRPNVGCEHKRRTHVAKV